MKYDLTKIFLNANDLPFTDENGSEVTVQKFFCTALLSDVDGNNQPVKGPEKLKRFDLYLKIKQATPGMVDLTSDEVVLLGQAAEVFSTILYGQVKYFLEQKT